MALELDIDGRMRAGGHDPTFSGSLMDDTRRRLLQPAFSIGPGIMAEAGAKHGISILDPTANISLIEFLLSVPDEQFRRRGQSSWLFQRAFRESLPEPVVQGRRKGLQASDVGHRILRELPAFRQCLDSLDPVPEAREILDLQLMRGCLEDLVAKIDPGTTARAGMILLRGLGVGLFLRHLADSRS
jgi:asparagine synthase (glutamine-hydrolysing)